MTVYVDLLFGLNAVINYLLLRGSAAMGGCPARFGRLIAAAVFGGLYAVASVLPGLEGLQSLTVQGLCAGVMLLTAFGWKRNTVKQGLFFFCLSFAFSGAVLLAVQLLEPDCVFLGGRAYYALSMPALLLLAGLCYGLAALVLGGCGTHTGGEIRAMTLELGGRTVAIRALLDTGNTLRDPVTGQAVLVLDREASEQLLPAMSEAVSDPAAHLQNLTDQCPNCRFRLIPYRTVGTESGLLLGVRCMVQIKRKKQDLLVALSPTAVCADGRFNAIWGGEIL